MTNTAADDHPDLAPDELAELEIRAGRRAPFSQVGDWVGLAAILPQAKLLYQILEMHVNAVRAADGDREVWPTQDMLAAMVGLSRGDKIKPHIDALVAMQAIEVRKIRYAGGMRERTIYTVHQTPPEDFAGVRSLQDWYRLNKAAILQKAAERAAKRKPKKPQVARVTPAEGTRDGQANPQVARATSPRGTRDTRDEVAGASRDGGTATTPVEDARATRDRGSNKTNLNNTNLNNTNGNETNREPGGRNAAPQAPAYRKTAGQVDSVVQAELAFEGDPQNARDARAAGPGPTDDEPDAADQVPGENARADIADQLAALKRRRQRQPVS